MADLPSSLQKRSRLLDQISAVASARAKPRRQSTTGMLETRPSHTSRDSSASAQLICAAAEQEALAHLKSAMNGKDLDGIQKAISEMEEIGYMPSELEPARQLRDQLEVRAVPCLYQCLDCLPACLVACLPGCLPACLLACLPACLPACSYTSPPPSSYCFRGYCSSLFCFPLVNPPACRPSVQFDPAPRDAKKPADLARALPDYFL